MLLTHAEILLQIFNLNLRSFMQTIGWALASSSNYYMSILSFKALTAPFWRLLIPNGNVRFYFLRYAIGLESYHKFKFKP